MHPEGNTGKPPGGYVAPEDISEAEFQKIRSLVHDLSGIRLHEEKKELVKARLGRRIRENRCRSFREYWQLILQDRTGRERIHLLDALSTNFTGFFREPAHFHYLGAEWAPRVLAARQDRKIRVWSAGCSSGEESYSIAITLRDALGGGETAEFQVLATDLSTRMLKIAAAGIYPQERIRSVSPQRVRKYFLRGEKRWHGYVKVKDEIRHRVTFQRVNLMEPVRLGEPFDCIFCRNVMIYFDQATQAALVDRLWQSLLPGGILLVGHSESLAGIPHRLRYVRPAIYQKEP